MLSNKILQKVSTAEILQNARVGTAVHCLLRPPVLSSGKRKQKVHIEYDLVGYSPVDELIKAEQA